MGQAARRAGNDRMDRPPTLVQRIGRNLRRLRARHHADHDGPRTPAALKAQYVQVAFDDMYSQGTYQGGVWRKSLIEWWLKATKFDPKSLEAFLKHPDYDSFWAEANAEAPGPRIDAPGVYWGGWYDIFLQGTIDSFVTIQHEGGPHARGQCRLIVGPYAHGTFTGLTYPANSQHQPEAADTFRFFDYHLKGRANGVEEEKPVHYYVMGDPTDPKAPGQFLASGRRLASSLAGDAVLFARRRPA